MSTRAKIVVAAVLATALTIPFVMQHRAQTALREENQALRQHVAAVQELKAENQNLANRLARMSNAPAATLPQDQFLELQRLRGEVGRLRTDVKEATATPKPPGPSPLSGITANPEMAKMIRNQQKMGMGMIYNNFAKSAGLNEEQSGKLYDVLADNVMENINHVSAVLKDGKTSEERDALFAHQEAIQNEQVHELLGDEGFAKYQEFTQNLASELTAEQFKGKLEGEDSAKKAKRDQIAALMKEESRKALEAAGLPPDFQLVPILNFRNIASEEEATRNLQLLDSIYDRVNGRMGSFLTQKELESFQEFRKTALENSRGALMMNRKMMAPIEQQATAP